MIALVVLMLAACDSAGAASVEREWLAHEHDAAALEQILAPDFIHAVGNGMFITKAQHIDYLAAHPFLPGHQAHFERLDIRLVNGVAIATGIVAATDGRTMFTDIFACRDRRWQAVSAQETVLPSTSR